ncbi:hypothetical protein THRCLA_02621 [Thraustotheca clavata]|uniref:EF-hand domain-containing protein n=1 Tax=Thraustotheca clavata TaxID=74557 RepID=A0A1W0A4J4_9STRA|nr:hypothetical protein THRCLA_02621 [Thraustotheca clavata]
MTNLHYTHPRTYGKDSRHCRTCATTRGLISKHTMEFETEYAVLRAARDKAWAIEKQLSIATTGFEREYVDWRTFDIPRDVAARISSLSSKLAKDPWTPLDIPHHKPSRKIIKPLRTVVPIQKPIPVVQTIEPKPVVALKRVVKPANEARATAVRKEIRDARKQKENERQKINHSIPVRKSTRPLQEMKKVKPPEIVSKITTAPTSVMPDIPSTPPKDNTSANIHDVATVDSTLANLHDVAESKGEVDFKTINSATLTAPTIENKEPASSLSEEPQLIPTINVEINQIAEKTWDAGSVDDIAQQVKAPINLERKRKPLHPSKTPIVSGIGKQILSENRTMPSAFFGFVNEASYGKAKNVPSVSLVRRLFNDLDANTDGYLDKLQVSVALHRLRINVDPQRISRFFEQAAQLNNSSLLLIDFRQFYAFVMAAIEHPDAHIQPPPKRKQKTEVKQPKIPEIEPAVFKEEDEPLYMEQTVSDYIVNRVLASVQKDVAPDIVASFDSEVLRTITRQLLAEQCQSRDNDELNPIGFDAYLERLNEPLNVELIEVEESKEDQVVALVKALVQSALHESQPRTPPKELLKPQERIVVDIATDTTDLPPLEEEAVLYEDKETQAIEEVIVDPEPQLTLNDLPGKTLLGKLLHTTQDQRNKVGVSRVVESSSLLESLRAMRTQRLQNSLPLENEDSKVSVIPQQETMDNKQPLIFEEPPPPAPPLSPRCQPELTSEPTPVAPKIYAPPIWRPKPASLGSLSRSSIASSKSSVPSSKTNELLSEGEIAEPNTYSDGEITGNSSRHIFYHLQTVKFHRKRQKAEMSPSSSMESGELVNQKQIFTNESSSESEDALDDVKSISSSSNSSFTGSIRAMSTGSIESGELS